MPQWLLRGCIYRSSDFESGSLKIFALDGVRPRDSVTNITPCITDSQKVHFGSALSRSPIVPEPLRVEYKRNCAHAGISRDVVPVQECRSVLHVAAAGKRYRKAGVCGFVGGSDTHRSFAIHVVNPCSRVPAPATSTREKKKGAGGVYFSFMGAQIHTKYLPYISLFPVFGYLHLLAYLRAFTQATFRHYSSLHSVYIWTISNESAPRTRIDRKSLFEFPSSWLQVIGERNIIPQWAIKQPSARNKVGQRGAGVVRRGGKLQNAECNASYQWEKARNSFTKTYHS